MSHEVANQQQPPPQQQFVSSHAIQQATATTINASSMLVTSLYRYYLGQVTDRVYNNNQQHHAAAAAEFVEGLIPMIGRCLIILLKLFLFLLSSTFLYFILYLLILPPPTRVKPLYFDYCHFSPSNINDNKNLHHECHNVPTAWVDLWAQHVESNHWNNAPLIGEVQPPPLDKRLHPGHAYFIEVVLEIPDSSYNYDLGMFSMAVELWGRNRTMENNKSEKKNKSPIPTNDDETKKNKNHGNPWRELTTTITTTPKQEANDKTSTTTCIEEGNTTAPAAGTNNDLLLLAKSVRSTLLPPQSSWIMILQKIILLIPLLAGALPESKRLTLSPFRYYVEHADYPLHSIHVQLMGSEYPPQILTGQVRIGTELSAVQQLLKDWFWTCAIVGITTIFAGQLSFYFAAKLAYRVWSQSRETQDENDGEAYYFDAAADNDEDWEAIDANESRPATNEGDTSPHEDQSQNSRNPNDNVSNTPHHFDDDDDMWVPIPQTEDTVPELQS